MIVADHPTYLTFVKQYILSVWNHLIVTISLFYECVFLQTRSFYNNNQKGAHTSRNPI